MAPRTTEHTGKGRKLTGFKRHKPAWRKGRRLMKRTTRKGAYKPAAKKAMVIRSNPFTETKSRTHEDVITDFPALPARNEFVTYDTPHLALNPDSLLAQKQSLSESGLLGNSCYSRYCNMKISIRFPQHAFTIGTDNKIVPVFPQNYELIWGWVPFPLGRTGSTTPTAPDTTLSDVHNHINLRVVDYMNERKDFLRFIPKKAATIRIKGRRKVRPNLNRYSTAPAQLMSDDSKFIGSIPDYNTSISWKTNRKIHYEPCSDLEGDGNDSGGLFMGNYQWLPFCTLVNWDYDLIETLVGSGAAKEDERKRYQPAVAYSDIHYYRDS